MGSTEMSSKELAAFLEGLSSYEPQLATKVVLKVTRPGYLVVNEIHFFHSVREAMFKFSLEDGGLRMFKKFFPTV